MVSKEQLVRKQTLKKKNKDGLVDCVLELSDASCSNKDQLEAKLTAGDVSGEQFVERLKRLIDLAASEIESHGPGTRESEVPHVGFDNVAEALVKALPRQLAEVLEIAEYALCSLDKVYELQFECELDYLVDAFRDLHLEACSRLQPERNLLALRLAELDRQMEWGFFEGPPVGYEQLLGTTGMSTFKSKQKVR